MLKKFNNLKISLKINILVTFVLIILISTFSFVRLSNNISIESDKIKSKGKILIEMSILSLKEPIWDFKNDAVKSFGDSLFNDNEIASVAIVDSKNRDLFKKELPDRINGYNLKYFKGDIKNNNETIATISIGMTDKLLKNQINDSIIKSVIEGFMMVIIFIVLIYISITYITRPLKKLVSVTESLSRGELDVRCKIFSEDEFGLLSRKFNTMADSLVKTINKTLETSKSLDNSMNIMQNTSISVISESKTLATSAETLAASFQEISAQMFEISDGSKNMTNVIMKNSKEANLAKLESETIRKSSFEGDMIIRETTEKINVISNCFNDIFNKVNALNDSSRKIQGIIDAIKKISSQTSLLSMNARIEAEKAGDQGKGFAIIASEINKLSIHTGVLIKQVNNTVIEINHDMLEATKSTEQGKNQIEEGVCLSKKVLEAIDSITNGINTSLLSIDNIVAGYEISVDVVRKIASNTEQVSEVVNDLANRTQDLAEISSTLNNMATKLCDVDNVKC